MYIKIQDKKIPIAIRNYKNSNKVKIYFKGTHLHVSKPQYVSDKEIIKIIQKNDKEIYEQYIKIISKENTDIKHWYTGEKFLYQGENYTIIRKEIHENTISIKIVDEEKQIQIAMPKLEDEEEEKKQIDTVIKRLLKNNTQALLQERLPYWSKKTKIQYNSFQVADAITRFGSCTVKTKVIHFSSRLIMLPQNKIDAIIVHELCHIIHANHSKQFYDLVKKYITNYDEIDDWLKENGKEIII